MCMYIVFFFLGQVWAKALTAGLDAGHEIGTSAQQHLSNHEKVQHSDEVGSASYGHSIPSDILMAEGQERVMQVATSKQNEKHKITEPTPHFCW